MKIPRMSRLRVAPIFGPRGVANPCPWRHGLRGDGDPATPSSLRLAPSDLPKIASNVAYADFLEGSGRRNLPGRSGGCAGPVEKLAPDECSTVVFGPGKNHLVNLAIGVLGSH